MTIKALAKQVMTNEQGYTHWTVISMHERLYKEFTDKIELKDFLLEYGKWGWKVDEIEEDENETHKLIIWVKM